MICQDLSNSVSISAKFGKFHQSSQTLAMFGQRIWRVCSSLYTSRYLACMLIAIHGRYFEGSTRAFFYSCTALVPFLEPRSSRRTRTRITRCPGRRWGSPLARPRVSRFRVRRASVGFSPTRTAWSTMLWSRSLFSSFFPPFFLLFSPSRWKRRVKLNK